MQAQAHKTFVGELTQCDNNGCVAVKITSEEYVTAPAEGDRLRQFDGPQQAQAIIDSIENEKDERQREYLIDRLLRYTIKAAATIYKGDTRRKYMRDRSEECMALSRFDTNRLIKIEKRASV